MLVTVNWISENYNKYNKLCWNGQLPNISFKISRSKKTWGYASFKYDYPNNAIIPETITISNYYDSPEKVKLNTLLHEMIHIADYTFHPEHFIQNHKRVSGHYYDAHGYWFNKECNRLKEFGFNVTNKVERSEIKVSRMSDKAKIAEMHKVNNALICVVYGTNCNFYFKTDIYKVNYLKKTLKNYTWYKIGDIRKIKFYTFKDDKLAAMRSCAKSVRGWHANNQRTMNFLERVKATDYIC